MSRACAIDWAKPFRHIGGTFIHALHHSTDVRGAILMIAWAAMYSARLWKSSDDSKNVVTRD